MSDYFSSCNCAGGWGGGGFTFPRVGFMGSPGIVAFPRGDPWLLFHLLLYVFLEVIPLGDRGNLLFKVVGWREMGLLFVLMICNYLLVHGSEI